MNIVHLGDDLLRQKSLPVEEVTDEVRAFISDMFETMRKADGIGLAAVQVGKLLRIFVVCADDDVDRVFINPQIVATSQEQTSYEEGCLSIPNTYEKILRPERITIQALNERGRPFTIEAEGLLARVIQHEYDHLEGLVFIDRGDETFRAKTIQKFTEAYEKKAGK